MIGFFFRLTEFSKNLKISDFRKISDFQKFKKSLIKSLKELVQRIRLSYEDRNLAGKCSETIPRVFWEHNNMFTNVLKLRNTKQLCEICTLSSKQLWSYVQKAILGRISLIPQLPLIIWVSFWRRIFKVPTLRSCNFWLARWIFFLSIEVGT